ncbi:hypothetical protein HPB47_023548 [Ixodes persulcatus]|uniref:Uncharacterized protein n=1 Tax=Ixodes persulcatus TaxID=34615 RepID=A0AC60Q6Q1_IXOPE|nr:hypothetical protein HPB47_023548 [Ixodes persulcatus]
MRFSFHPDRRTSRAKALGRILGGSDEVVYVDAALCGKNKFALAVVNGHFKVVKTIVSDAKTAIMANSMEYIPTTAIRILRQLDRLDSAVDLVWTPTRSGLEDSEVAHKAARGLISRPASNDHSDAPFEPLYTFDEITHHYKESSGSYLPPHASLNRGMPVVWRQLQTNTFPTPSRLSHIYPDLFSPQRKRCPPPPPPPPISISQTLKAKVESGQWELLLLNSDEESQRLIINWTLSVAFRWPQGSTERSLPRLSPSWSIKFSLSLSLSLALSDPSTAKKKNNK